MKRTITLLLSAVLAIAVAAPAAASEYRSVASIVGAPQSAPAQSFHSSIAATLGAPAAKASDGNSSVASIVGAPAGASAQTVTADSADFGFSLWEGFLAAGVTLVLLLVVVTTVVRRRGPVGSHA
jgi:hypothetical protein